MTTSDTLAVADIAALAKSAYGRAFDAHQIALGGYGKPGDGFGRQVFYGSQYLGRIDRGSFVADSRNWQRVVVQIYDEETEQVVYESAPTSARRAEKIEDGISINLNQGRFSTRVVPQASA